MAAGGDGVGDGEARENFAIAGVAPYARSPTKIAVPAGCHVAMSAVEHA